ncbi:YciI family protein [Gephyromycinifex aptenodytis]|uniref:YciI family protein n=1 Tax=Gephyromycinifex aptenodytis TaxID=2716227 RepID=UPI0014467D78|nr:YciI family protein [Gephyromycinifex aptenodytis]
MAFYVVNYHYSSDPRLEQVRPAHREFLGGLVSSGLLRASGPLVGVDSPAAVLIFEADAPAAVESALADDPFQKEGLVQRWDVTEWNPVLGVFAS